MQLRRRVGDEQIGRTLAATDHQIDRPIKVHIARQKRLCGARLLRGQINGATRAERSTCIPKQHSEHVFGRAAHQQIELAITVDVDKLNVTPIDQEVDLPEGGKAKVVVTGDMLLGYLFQNLYNRSAIEAVPQIIDLFDKGDADAVASEIGYMVDQFLDRPDWGDALGLSVDCHEEVPFNNLKKLQAEYRKYPLLKSFAEDDSWGAACAVWPMGPVDPVENAPIFSAVPALLLTGLYDPVTPPQYARLAGSRLVNSYYFEFPSVGHDVLSNEPCAGEIAKLFLDDPTRMPTHECLGDIQPPDFRPPAR